MRTEHMLVVLAAFAFLVPSSLAVVGGPEPGKGEFAITSTGSSGASQAVGPNGTQWRAEVSMANRTTDVTDDSVTGVRYGEDNYTVEFTGFITAPTPCHVIEHDVEETEGGYVMNIETIHDRTDGGGSACAQVLTMIEYDAEFSAQEDFTLEVRHGNETVEKLDHPGLEADKPERKGFFAGIFRFLGGLF